MSLFQSAGKALSGVFSGLYPDGTLHKQTETQADNGDVSVTTENIPIKAQVDSATEAMKSDEGYASTDVAIFVLRPDLALSITTDDEVTAEGRRYAIGGPVRKDTAKSHFILRGVTK